MIRSAWLTTTLKNWNEFTRWSTRFESERPSAYTYLFRGQSESNWSLISKLQRRNRSKARLNELLRIEDLAEREFKAQAHLHFRTSIIPPTDEHFSWWILQQHYNAPTRLLDWSISPYVAAYFACETNWKSSGALWCFDHSSLDVIFREELSEIYSKALTKDGSQIFWSPGAPDFICMIERKTKTERMIAQQGVSTLASSVLADQAEVIAAAFSGSHVNSPFQKLVIPSSLKPEFLLHLRSMNITANALFPGVDGLGRSVDELVKLELA